MGITGLLPLLDKASKKCNVSEFSGCTVAVDTYCWLHKGAFSCADKIARGEFTDAHIKYCMKYVNMLLSHSIKPILVFDGRHLPAKALTEAKRRESRSIAKKRAAELLRLGQVDEARSYMRRCVDITHEMALMLIKECRQRNVDCIVAPYEADAQMAYLNKINIADIVITEDSDLVLFGCSKIFFKMDLNGNGVLVESSKLPLVMKCPLEHYNFNKFRQMCIMSGCDYLASLPGIGLAKARQFINATRDPDIRNALKKLPSYFNRHQLVVTDEYRDSFLKAEATFKHQLVFDPIQRKLLPLNSLESEGTDIELCTNAGEDLDPEIAFQLALGNLDPFSLKKMDDWHPDHAKEAKGGKTNGWNQINKAPHKSIWNKGYMDHAQRHSMNKTKNETAISFPTTRALTTKIQVVQREGSEGNGLTIEDLSSMYCIKETVKQNVIIPETQDFDDIECFKNPCNERVTSPENSLSINNHNETLSARKRRRTSPEKENSPSPEKDRSPILENRNRNFRRFLQSNSKLSKLSKFQRTTIDENNFVESKFFNSSSSSTTESTCKDSEESGLNLSGISKLHVGEIEDIPKREGQLGDTIDPVDKSLHNKRLTCDDLSWNMKHGDTVDLTTFESKKSVNPFGKSCSSSKMEKVLDSQSSYNDNTYPLEDLVTPVASQISTDSSQNCNEQLSQVLTKSSMVYSQHISTTSLSQPSMRSNSNLSKNGLKSNSCRRPGLQRKTSAPVLSAGQKTLANFGFFQKSQLKH